MSAPSSLRALSTSRSTLLPFLYTTTRTIRQTRPRGFHFQSQARAIHHGVEHERGYDKLGPGSEIAWPSESFHGSQTRYANVTGNSVAVPFEDEIASPDDYDLDQEHAFRNRTSTITPSERQVFAKLYKGLVNQPIDNGNEDLSDNVLDELDAVLARATPFPKHKIKPNERSRDAPSALEVAQSKLGLRSFSGDDGDSLSGGAPADKKDNAPLIAAQREQYAQVERMLLAANTDIELWNVLENEVFAVIRRLDLDGKQQGVLEGEKEAALNAADEQKLSDLAIIGMNYPSFLLIAVRQLRLEFPTSGLILAIVPAMRRLGRSSYALGASTLLYNELIKALWYTYSDFQAVDELLHEMENGGVDFDHHTCDILDTIKQRSAKFRADHKRDADEFTTVWQTERFKRGLTKIISWRNLIWSRLQAEAVRKARERSELFRT